MRNHLLSDKDCANQLVKCARGGCNITFPKSKFAEHQMLCVWNTCLCLACGMTYLQSEGHRCDKRYTMRILSCVNRTGFPFKTAPGFPAEQMYLFEAEYEAHYFNGSITTFVRPRDYVLQLWSDVEFPHQLSEVQKLLDNNKLFWSTREKNTFLGCRLATSRDPPL